MGCGVTSVRSESRGYTRYERRREFTQKGYGFMRALHQMGDAPLSNGTASGNPGYNILRNHAGVAWGAA
jgi:hypothetical protein|eukprot:1629452-Prymnesium_polylepis.1